METIKVNMNPNPLDVQTIHASQNDGEARQWGFELHNNGELIDTSDVKEQLFFKAYKGGTEEILPTNGSTPTTSPFIGDIKYPQGLLTDQYFTYRESPTPVDGLAKIKRIKGNTLVWNQLVENGNFASTSGWSATKGTFTVSGNVGTYRVTELATNTYESRISRDITVPANHKVLIMCDIKPKHTHSFYIFLINTSGNPNKSVTVTENVWNKVGVELTTTTVASIVQFAFNTQSSQGYSVGDEEQIKNAQVVDLTEMFGAGNEPSAEGFKELFPLPYYAYNQGTLLSFMGNGIKTTNADETEESTLSLPISTYFSNGMKSAGSVYDELTESKAITRIGAVDLGSLTYIYDGECFIGKLPSDAKVLSANTETLNSITPPYQINNWTAVKFNKANMTLGTGVSTYICIFNTSYTDPALFKTAMSGVYLYYELATPTETSFTTASLVTENAEIPLSNEDGALIGKCTEQLSSESGFFDAKIKLADEDGECYSNKIQLHVEREPS